MEQPKRRLSAICFADIVGYTELSNRDEPAALALVHAFQTLTADVVAAYEGRIVKFIGDAVLIEFGSTDSAVRAAVAIQERYGAAARELKQPSQLRIGVHLGEVNATADGDVYGDGVNMASRLHHEATPGRVIVSEDVWRQLRQRPEFRFAPLGAVELRGISTRVEVFDVLFGARAALTSPAGAPPPAAATATATTRGPWIPIGIAAVALLVVILLFTRSWNAPPVAEIAPAAQPPETAAAPAQTPQAAAPAPVPAPATAAPPPSPPPAAAAERPAPGQEVRTLIEDLAAALTSEQPDAVAALGPGAGTMSAAGLQQLHQAFGSGLNVRFGRIERMEPTGNGAGAVRFTLVARSDSRAETPLRFQGVVQRVNGAMRFLELRRELAGARGRTGR